MSSRRIVAASAAMALMVGTGSWYAVSAFPLQATASLSASNQAEAGPLERKARMVTPENPIPRRVHYEEPVLADWVGSERAMLDVTITLDELGRVAEARIVGVYRPAAFHNDAERTRRANEAIAEAVLASVRQGRYDAPFEAPLTFSVQVRIGKAAPVMEFSAKPADDALRVGGNIKPPAKIKDVRPVYPPAAREAGIAGVVILEVRIGTDGLIEEAHVVKSIPLLDQAALDAVRQWQFAPTLMNGQPTPITMAVTINFAQ